jgi:hypothetical protein
LLNNGLGEVNTADVTIETGLNYMRSMEGKWNPLIKVKKLR